MFPHFDDLTDSQLSTSAQAMAQLGFAEAEAAARILGRLRVQWLAIHR